jgi:hypothetical protein
MDTVDAVRQSRTSDTGTKALWVEAYGHQMISEQPA